MYPDSEICAQLYSYVTHPVTQVLFILYFLSSLLALFLTVPIIRYFQKKTIFHPNLKILIVFMTMYTFIFSLIMCITCVHSFIHIFHHTEKCEVIFKVADCLWSFPLITWCLVGIVLTQVLISIERTVSTILVHKYQFTGRRFGYILTFINICGTTGLTFYGLSEIDLEDAQTVCAAIPNSTARTANILFFLLLFLDLTNVSLFTFAWYYNKVQVRAKEYCIARKFQVAENFCVIKLFLPVAILHFVLFAIYISATVVFRNQRLNYDPITFRLLCSIVYVIPYYATAQNIFFTLILRHQNNEREKLLSDFQCNRHFQEPELARNMHFSTLEQQWSTKIFSTPTTT